MKRRSGQLMTTPGMCPTLRYAWTTLSGRRGFRIVRADEESHDVHVSLRVGAVVPHPHFEVRRADKQKKSAWSRAHAAALHAGQRHGDYVMRGKNSSSISSWRNIPRSQPRSSSVCAGLSPSRRDLPRVNFAAARSFVLALLPPVGGSGLGHQAPGVQQAVERPGIGPPAGTSSSHVISSRSI